MWRFVQIELIRAKRTRADRKWTSRPQQQLSVDTYTQQPEHALSSTHKNHLGLMLQSTKMNFMQIEKIAFNWL